MRGVNEEQLAVSERAPWYFSFGRKLGATRMRISSKGQVTIPTAIRKRLGFRPGAEVEFEIVGDALHLYEIRRGRGRRAVEALRGTATAGLSTDQIMALTRGYGEIDRNGR